MIANILGTEYTVIVKERSEDIKLSEANGYTDFSTKQIVICDLSKESNDTDNMGNIDVYLKKVLRHETIHALFYESGINDWARDEMLVDWIAIQIPKLIDGWKELKAL